MPQIDILFYSHTHGWEIKGLKQVFQAFREANIPTASVHLDRWAWLDREKDIGTEATWFTEYQFMADGSPEAEEIYEKHNLNWHWLKPGVIERDCYLAEPNREKYPFDIIFVGSRGYHPEYKERPLLVDFLHARYAGRFGHYGNDGLGVVREEELNIYTLVPIVVGDSCLR